ncbi:MAG: flippase [Chitinispirillaceae bacterium]|nr:flippase [Chitinispirillaceae bacterium]
MSAASGKSILGKIGKNSFFASCTTVLSAVAGLVTSVVLARYLGAEEYGTYSYLLWIIGIVAIFANFGLPNTVIKYVAEYNAKSSESARTFYSAILKMEALLSIGGSLIIAVWGVLKTDALLMCIAALLLIPQSIGRIVSSTAHGLQLYEITTRARFLTTPLQVAVLWVLLVSGRGVAEVLILMTAAETAQCIIIGAAIIKKLGRTREKRGHGVVAWERVVRFSASVFVITLLDAVVWQKSEVFFLKQFSSITAVGFYSLSYGLTYMIMQIPATVTNVIFPVFSEAYGADAGDILRRGYYYSIKYLALMLLPSTTLCGIVAPQVITLLYGEQYLPAAPVLRILLVVSALATIHRPISTTLYSTENQNFITKITLLLAVINIALDCILIPDYGIIGAAAANGAAQLGSVILGLIFIHTRFSYPYPLAVVAKIAACCLLPSIPFALLSGIVAGLPGLAICCCGFPLLFVGMMHVVKPLHESADRKIFGMMEMKIPPCCRGAFGFFTRCMGVPQVNVAGERQ